MARHQITRRFLMLGHLQKARRGKLLRIAVISILSFSAILRRLPLTARERISTAVKYEFGCDADALPISIHR